MDWLSNRLEFCPVMDDLSLGARYSRQQLKLIVRMHIGGGDILSNIARREAISSANLCAAFRKLESDGIVNRCVDESDRRNVMYSLSEEGHEVAVKMLEILCGRLGRFFEMIGHDDRDRLISAMGQINEILEKFKEKWK